MPALNHSDPSVRRVVEELFSTLNSILFAYSAFVRISNQLGNPGRTLPLGIQRVVSQILTIQYGALMLSLSIDRTKLRLATA